MELWIYSPTLSPGPGSGQSNWRRQSPGRDTKESGTSGGRKYSVIQSGLSEAAWFERFVMLEQNLECLRSIQCVTGEEALGGYGMGGRLDGQKG